MILIILSAYLLAILPVVLVVTLVAGFARLKRKGRDRSVLLENFRNAHFSNEDDLSWYIAHDVIGKAGYVDCVIYKVDQKDQVCRQIAAFGPKNPDKMSILNPINIPFARGIVGHVAMSGKAEKIDDTTKDARYMPDDDVRYSELTVPVLRDGKSIMVIDSEHKKAAWFKASDVEFFREVATITESKLNAL
jgi:two-component system, LytTR family, sensor kinase